MKLVIQRVREAKVDVEGNTIGKIGKGFLILIGVTHNDTKEIAEKLAKKVMKLRIFEDENGKMNFNIKDVKGNILVVSQFTLYADCSGGNRPSFTNAAKQDIANDLYEYFCEKCEEEIERKIQKGIFGADMKVSLINDGPVTIILEERNS